MINFTEWVFYRELEFNENTNIVKTLYHGSTMEHVQSIMNRGVLNQLRDWSVNEFWATNDLSKAKVMAHVQSDVEDVQNPPPLGVFKFDIPLKVLKIIKREGMLYTPEPGIYEFGVKSFHLLNNYMSNKIVIPIKANDFSMS